MENLMPDVQKLAIKYSAGMITKAEFIFELGDDPDFFRYMVLLVRRLEKVNKT